MASIAGIIVLAVLTFLLLCGFVGTLVLALITQRKYRKAKKEVARLRVKCDKPPPACPAPAPVPPPKPSPPPPPTTVVMIPPPAVSTPRSGVLGVTYNSTDPRVDRSLDAAQALIVELQRAMCTELAPDIMAIIDQTMADMFNDASGSSCEELRAAMQQSMPSALEEGFSGVDIQPHNKAAIAAASVGLLNAIIDGSCNPATGKIDVALAQQMARGAIRSVCP